MATFSHYVPIRLPDDQLKELDRLVKERETNRSEVLRLGLRVLAESQQRGDQQRRGRRQDNEGA